MSRGFQNLSHRKRRGGGIRFIFGSIVQGETLTSKNRVGTPYISENFGVDKEVNGKKAEMKSRDCVVDRCFSVLFNNSPLKLWKARPSCG